MLLCLWKEDKVIESIATIVIMAGSVLLFAYWFRYTCLLMLHARTTRDYATEVATANQLSFANVRSELCEPNADLDGLRKLLDQDYALVTRLMNEVAAGQSGIEEQMLAFNYRLASMRYQVAQRFSMQSARQALEEMSMVVAHFANSVGEASAAAAA
jgi:hypothetical protein